MRTHLCCQVRKSSAQLLIVSPRCECWSAQRTVQACAGLDATLCRAACGLRKGRPRQHRLVDHQLPLSCVMIIS
eukprot:866382-Pleurochrysis_carterae.AAC.1